MKQTKTRAFSWLLMLVMVFSLISPSAVQQVNAEETKAYDGYVYVTVEKFTLGQGFVQEPIKVGYYESENLENVLRRGLGDNMIGESGQYGLYVTGFKDGGEPEGWTKDQIPAKILEKLESGNTTITPREKDDVTLDGGDYTANSNFSLVVDDKTALSGATSITYKADTEDGTSYHNGSVIRWEYSIYSYYDAATNYFESDSSLIDFPNKDDLIKKLADWKLNKKDTTYQKALSVAADWDATAEEVAAATKTLYQNELSDSYKEKEDAVIKYSLKSVESPVYGSEWTVFGVARSGMDDAAWYHAYKNAIDDKMSEVQANVIGKQATDNARTIIALTAAGIDVTDVAGYNLLEPLADYDYVTKQGLNGAVYALLALDCGNYEIPTAAEGVTQTTKDNLVETILSKKIENGGWAYFGNTPDPDMTSMVMQALAPYTDKTDVKEAIEEAITILSDTQQNDGGYVSWGDANAESCAQVICGLAAVGIDVETDSRFVKNGNSVLDALLAFYDETKGGFKHIAADGKVDDGATSQSLYALVAYDRMLNEKNDLYDMSDVKAGTFYKCADSKKTTANKKTATCTEDGYTGDIVCDKCGLVYEEGKAIPKKGHTVVIDPAVEPTEDKEGKTEGSHCSVCNTVLKAQTVIPKKEKKSEQPASTEQATTAQATTQQPTTQATTEAAKVVLKKPAIAKAKSSKKGQLKLTWKAVLNISGYQIQVSTSSKFKKAKTYNVKKSMLNKTLKGLVSGKKYYVRTRTYTKVTVDGKQQTRYSKWSKVKKVKVK